MKKNLFHTALCLCLVAALTVHFFPATTAFAATCRTSACDYVDPYGTTCWNDAVNAVIHYASTMYNINKYSSGCVANWSYVQNTNTTKYLGAETVGISQYDDPKHQLYAWNSMWDGTGTVCTRGHMGPSAGNYNVNTTSACA